MSLDITFHAIECGVTTCPGYGGSCHKRPSLIKWSLTTIVLRLKEIRYCSIVARSSLKTLAYHSLPKYLMQKNTKSLKRNVWQPAPVYPIYNNVSRCKRINNNSRLKTLYDNGSRYHTYNVFFKHCPVEPRIASHRFDFFERKVCLVPLSWLLEGESCELEEGERARRTKRESERESSN